MHGRNVIICDPRSVCIVAEALYHYMGLIRLCRVYNMYICIYGLHEVRLEGQVHIHLYTGLYTSIGLIFVCCFGVISGGPFRLLM